MFARNTLSISVLQIVRILEIEECVDYKVKRKVFMYCLWHITFADTFTSLIKTAEKQ